jgi:hypothetical protein
MLFMSDFTLFFDLRVFANDMLVAVSYCDSVLNEIHIDI